MQLLDRTLTIMGLALFAIMGLQGEVLSKVLQETPVPDVSDARQNLSTSFLLARGYYPDGRQGGGGEGSPNIGGPGSSR